MKIESSKIPLLPQISTFYNALLLGHVTVREEEAVLSYLHLHDTVKIWEKREARPDRL